MTFYSLCRKIGKADQKWVPYKNHLIIEKSLKNFQMQEQLMPYFQNVDYLDYRLVQILPRIVAKSNLFTVSNCGKVSTLIPKTKGLGIVLEILHCRIKEHSLRSSRKTCGKIIYK